VNPTTNKQLVRRVNDLGNLPAMPSILQSLGETLSANPSDVNLERIVELISYDKSLAAQCLRIGNSALFGRRAEVESIKGAVLSLGLRRVRDIVYSCSLPNLFASAKQGMAPDTFWRHALGTAFVSQQLAERLGVQDVEKLYLAGLLHDIGILVNALLFEEQFHQVLETAAASEIPLCEVELQELGFTHCDSGRILADIWKLPADIAEVVEYHHDPSSNQPAAEISSLVHLADLLCRVRGLGYGYYEARGFELASEAAWTILQQKYPAVAGLDLARFTFELDEYAARVETMVDSIFATGGAP
jgi:putative nucleotidyltransferase with HDIG domain